MLDFCPSGIFSTRFHDGFDESHAANAVFDFGIVGHDGVRSLAGEGAADVRSEVFVDVCKGLKVALGVCRRGSSGGECGGPEVAVCCAVDFHRFVQPLNEEGVGLFLMPLEATFLAIDANVEVVFFADADLGAVQDTFRTIFQADEDVCVVVELTTFHKGGEIGGKFLNLQAGDVLGEVFRVGANIADATGCA